MRLEVWVPGLPIPQGSKKAMMSHSTNKPIVIDNNRIGLAQWRAQLAAHIIDKWGQPAEEVAAFGVRLEFYLPRRTSDYLPVNSKRDKKELRPGAPTYVTTAPDVVLVRTHPLGLMTITDAVPDTLIEGKPQCHVIAVAKEQGRVAASVGCALSRARTGMPATELACALPGSRLDELVDAIERAAAIDANVARYAGDDAARFATVAS